METMASGATLADLGAKFGRKYTLTIKPAYRIDGGKYVPLESEEQETIVISNPLTLEFDVNRDALASANMGTFRIYNLSEDTRNRLYKDPFSQWIYRPIILQAGYNEPLPTIFAGNIKQALSYRNPGSVDFITEIQAYDFAFAMAMAHSSWAINNPTTKQDVITRLIGDLKGFEVEQGVVGAFEGSYARGYSVCGPTWEELQKETGRSAFIDLGKIHVLKDNDCFDGNISIIASETGLLGTPRRSEHVIVAEMIFEPRLQIGQVIELRSSSQTKLNGQYKVIGIRHTGNISDAVGGKCQTSVQLFLGTEILNVLSGQAG